MRHFIEYMKACFFAERERWVVWLSVLFGAGIGFYFLLKQEPSPWLILVVVEVLLYLLYRWRYFPERMLSLTVLLMMALGFSDIQLQALYQAKHLQNPTENETIYLKGRILEVGKNAKGKVRLLLTDAADFDNLRKGLFRVTLTSKESSLKEGQCVALAATLMRPSLPALPNGYQFDRKAYFENISAVGYANSSVFLVDCEKEPDLKDRIIYFINYVRGKIAARINRILPPDEAGMTTAIVAGDRSGISEEITENYRDSGLAHFISISGLHMSMVAAMAFFFVRLLIALVPYWALRCDSKKIAAAFAIVMSFVYLLISGAEIPAQRAFITTLVVLIGVMCSRRAISMRMVSFAALVVLLISPQALISVSFQMSFAAVVVLIAFYERYAAAIHRFFAGRGFFRVMAAYFVGLVLSDLVASLATLPFSIYHFNQIAVYTTLTNLLAGPVIGFIIMPFVLAALFLMPLGLDVLPLKIVGFGMSVINDITAYVAGLPNAGYHVLSMPFWGLMLMIAGGLWLCIWQQKWRQWGVLPVIIGMLSIFTVQKPDMLYDATGKAVAVQDNAGNVVIMPGRGNRWIKDIWLEKTVSLPIDKAEAKDLKKIYAGEKTDFDWLALKCTREECVYKDVVHWNKKGEISIGGVKRNTQNDGGGAVFIQDGKAEVRTVRDSVGQRLWN